MNGVVRFKRLHNRTAQDVFNNMIRPQLPLVLDIVCQKITYYNRHNHNYQNRTGALENSVSWVPAEMHGATAKAAVIAGGPSEAKYDYVMDVVFYHDEQGRLRRFEPAQPRTIRAGEKIDVRYAVFVERKGRPVLKQGIEHFRPQIAAIIAANLKQKNLPRMYTFKYSGETKDIYGG
jgi:hypothetical protein